MMEDLEAEYMFTSVQKDEQSAKTQLSAGGGHAETFSQPHDNSPTSTSSNAAH